MKRIFYITMSEITVFHWHKNKIVAQYHFQSDEHAQSEFFQYLKKQPQIISYAVVDMVEEEFHCMQIAKMSAGNRKAYVERKLNTKFRGKNYRLALYQGKSQSTESHDEVLLTALTNPYSLSLFLAWIDKHKVPLQGIYSIPLLSAHLLKQLKINNQNSLLVHEVSNSYLRQTYFHNHHIKSSRLSKINNDESDLSLIILNEVQKNERYLNRFHLLPKGAALNINVICGDQQYDHLSEHLNNTKDWNFKLIHIDTLTQALKISEPINSNQTEVLFAHIIAQQHLNGNYANFNQRRYYWFKYANSSMLTASVLLGLFTIIYNGNLFLKSKDLQSQTALIEQRAKFLQQHYQKASRERLRTFYTPEAMQQTVVLAKKLQATDFNINDLYKIIAYHLISFPDIALQGLSWETSYRLNLDNNHALLQQNANDDIAESQQYIYRTVSLKVRLLDFNGDYIAAFERVKQFTEHLKSNKKIYKVIVSKLPLSINSKSVSTGDSGAELRAIKANFSVKLVFRSSLNET